VSFGTTSSPRILTNVAAGVGPTDAVNVAQLNSVAAGMSSQIGGLQSQINQANSGIAMAMAMGGGFLPDNKKFAVSTNYGTFAGQSALGLTGLVRVTNNLVLSGSAGFAPVNDTNQFGGRVGLQYAW
jgi:autotransporter adhesin